MFLLPPHSFFHSTLEFGVRLLLSHEMLVPGSPTRASYMNQIPCRGHTSSGAISISCHISLSFLQFMFSQVFCKVYATKIKTGHASILINWHNVLSCLATQWFHFVTIDFPFRNMMMLLGDWKVGTVKSYGKRFAKCQNQWTIFSFHLSNTSVVLLFPIETIFTFVFADTTLVWFNFSGTSSQEL